MSIYRTTKQFLYATVLPSRLAMRRRFWHTMPDVRSRFAGVPTMLSEDEIKLLYWLTRDYYSGRGGIIELGPFLGGSTSALCEGLADNRRVPEPHKLVHSFDLFSHDSRHWGYLALIGEKLDEGQSFLPIYRRLIAPYREYVSVHAGDIVETPHPGGPIEILFVDICKSWHINASVVAKFFGHLIPGKSVVVQQDYIHDWHYWLHVTMDFFRDHFEYMGRVEKGHSEVFRCTKRIPQELLFVDLEALPKARKCEAFERVLERFPVNDWQRTLILLAYATMLVLDHDDEAASLAVYRRTNPAWAEDPIVKDCAGRYLWVVEQARLPEGQRSCYFPRRLGKVRAA